MKPGRKPGTPKTGGRQPGSRNKVAGKTKDWILQVIEDNKQNFVADLQNIEPEKRADIFLKLLSFVVPKPQDISLQAEYRYLEHLLHTTPDSFTQAIAEKIVSLNLKSKEFHHDQTATIE